VYASKLQRKRPRQSGGHDARGASRVQGPISEKEPSRPAGDAAAGPFREAVPPIRANPLDHVESALPRHLQKARQIGGVVLKVPVESRDPTAPRGGDSGGDRRGLAPALRQAQGPQEVLPARQTEQLREGPIRGSVVHDDQFAVDAGGDESAPRLLD